MTESLKFRISWDSYEEKYNNEIHLNVIPHVLLLS